MQACPWQNSSSVNLYIGASLSIHNERAKYPSSSFQVDAFYIWRNFIHSYVMYPFLKIKGWIFHRKCREKCFIALFYHFPFWQIGRDIRFHRICKNQQSFLIAIFTNFHRKLSWTVEHKKETVSILFIHFYIVSGRIHFNFFPFYIFIHPHCNFHLSLKREMPPMNTSAFEFSQRLVIVFPLSRHSFKISVTDIFKDSHVIICVIIQIHTI